MQVKKLVRSAQSMFPVLKPVKDSFYRVSRRFLRRPHDKDFRALALLPDSDLDWVDVGANQGQSIESIRVMKPRARVIAFEPNVLLAGKLARRYRRDSSIVVRAAGLATATGTFPLFTPIYRGFVYDGLASMDRDHATSWLGPRTLYLFDPAKLRVHEQSCPVSTLDLENLHPVFVKIDVQGLELQVVKGGIGTIDRYKPALLIEKSSHDGEIDALLGPLGYRSYYFDGLGFQEGRGGSANRFLLTARHLLADALGD